MIQIKIPIGSRGTQIIVAAADPKATLQWAALFDEIPGECGNPNCSCKDLRFSFRDPKGNKFYSVVCTNCNWTLPFGEHKEGGTMYLKQWEPPYSAQQSGGFQQQPQQGQPVQQVQQVLYDPNGNPVQQQPVQQPQPQQQFQQPQQQAAPVQQVATPAGQGFE